MKKQLIVLLTFSTMLTFLGSAATAGHFQKKAKVSGISIAAFVRFEPVPVTSGTAVFDVALQGSFDLLIGKEQRTGSFHFPHLLEFPNDPATEDGVIAGVAIYQFDDGLRCLGNLGGPIGATGFRGTGRLNCSDGSRLYLNTNDEGVDPGGSVRASIEGKLIRKRRGRYI